MVTAGQPTAEPVIENTTVEGRHGSIPLRIYAPAPATMTSGSVPLVWVHGGAFFSGGLDQPESHAVACAVARRGRTVVTVDYRLVPPFNWIRKPKPGPLPGIRFPVPLDDVCDAFAWAREQSPDGHVFLGGASAGACLCAAATLRMRDEGHRGPYGLALVYGTFHAALPALSAQLTRRLRGRHGILQFRPGTVDKMNRNYAGSLSAMKSPYAFPGGADLTEFPRTLVLNADRDSLRASGDAFAEELTTAGAPVDHHVVPETGHGFLNRPARPHFRTGIDILTSWLDQQDDG